MCVHTLQIPGHSLTGSLLQRFVFVQGANISFTTQNTRLCKQVLYDDTVWYGGVLEAGPELRDGEGFLVLKFCFPFCG